MPASNQLWPTDIRHPLTWRNQTQQGGVGRKTQSIAFLEIFRWSKLSTSPISAIETPLPVARNRIALTLVNFLSNNGKPSIFHHSPSPLRFTYTCRAIAKNAPRRTPIEVIIDSITAFLGRISSFGTRAGSTTLNAYSTSAFAIIMD